MGTLVNSVWQKGKLIIKGLIIGFNGAYAVATLATVGLITCLSEDCCIRQNFPCSCHLYCCCYIPMYSPYCNCRITPYCLVVLDYS